jgi:cytochrome c-type biogenesis protein CcmH/NrfG
VTVAAILCASAVLAAARERGRAEPAARARWTLLAVAIGVGVVALLGLLGNQALVRSGNALKQGNFAAAVAAADDARRWAPWSAQPWQQLASIRIVQGDRAGARAAYRKAVTKDPRDWELWLGLASVSTGAERGRAVARLAKLSPAAASGFSSGSP